MVARRTRQAALVTDPSPLQIAAFRGNEAEVRALLENGADPNTVDDDKDTPLHTVARRCHWNRPEDERRAYAAIATALIEAGCDPLAKNANGWTAAECAIGNDTGEVIAVISKVAKIPLRAAVQTGSAKIVARVLAGGVSTIKAHDLSDTLTHCCEPESEHGLKFLRMILDAGAPITGPKTRIRWTPSDAVTAGNVDAVKLLLKYGADRTSMIKAARDDEEMLRVLGRAPARAARSLSVEELPEWNATQAMLVYGRRADADERPRKRVSKAIELAFQWSQARGLVPPAGVGSIRCAWGTDLRAELSGRHVRGGCVVGVLVDIASAALGAPHKLDASRIAAAIETCATVSPEEWDAMSELVGPLGECGLYLVASGPLAQAVLARGTVVAAAGATIVGRDMEQARHRRGVKGKQIGATDGSTEIGLGAVRRGDVFLVARHD